MAQIQLRRFAEGEANVRRALRAEIDAQAAREGWPALHAELARVDPITAQRLPPSS